MKIGNIVRIRKDLEEGRMYGVCTFAAPMKEYLGKEGTIIEINRKYFYLSIEGEELTYKFTEDMIEKDETIEVESEVIDEEEVTEDVVQAVASAIVEEAEENEKTIEEVVTDIVDESTEEVVDETEEIVEEEPIIETKKTNKKK